MADLNKAELRRLAEAAGVSTKGVWTLYIPEDYQGRDNLPGYGVEDSEGRAVVWGSTEPETGFQHDEQAEYVAAANPAAILALLDENDQLREELSGIKNVNTEIFQALKSLTMHARTSGGTAGPDAGLMAACEQAEKMLSLGGIGRAYMVGADAVEVEALRKDAARWQCVRNAIPMQSPYAVWREGAHVVLGKDADEMVDNFLAAKEGSANG